MITARREPNISAAGVKLHITGEVPTVLTLTGCCWHSEEAARLKITRLLDLELQN